MDEMLAEFIKYTIIGVGAGVLVLASVIFVTMTKPKRLKIGNLLAAEWADKESGSVALNLDGTRKILIMPEIFEQGMIQSAANQREIDDEQRAYWDNSVAYAREKVKTLAFDVAAHLDIAADRTEDKNLAEMIINNAGLIRELLEYKIMEVLDRSIKSNGFYHMVHLEGQQKIPKPEWYKYLDNQATTIYGILRHAVGNKIGWAQITPEIKAEADAGGKGITVADIFLRKSGKGPEDVTKLMETIYSAAWDYQHMYKQRMKADDCWRSRVITSVRNDGKYLHPDHI